MPAGDWQVTLALPIVRARRAAAGAGGILAAVVLGALAYAAGDGRFNRSKRRSVASAPASRASA